VVKLRRAIIASLVPGVVLALSLAGCGDLLGLKDLEPYPADGSADSSEDSSPDGTTGDTGVIPTDGAGGDGHDEMGTGDGSSSDGTTAADSPGADAPADTSEPIDSSMGHDSSTGPDSSMGVDSSTGMDSSTAEDTSTGPDSSCTIGTSLNCGSCGHNCFGGACVSGQCQPFVLASSITAYDLVAVNGSLYWVDQNSSVLTCVVTNGTCSPQTIATGQSTPERIAYDGNAYIYWSNYGTGGGPDGSIMSYKLSNGTTTPVASSIWTPEGVAADSTYVFWAEFAMAAPAKIVRLTLSNSMTATYLPASTAGPTAVALRSGEVYWTEADDGNVEENQESSSFTPTNVAMGQSSPLALSVDATYLYWVDFVGQGPVWQYTLSNAQSRQLAPMEDFPVRVASDAARVYWLDQGALNGSSGKLVGCDPTSCTPADLDTSLKTGASLAIDSNAVYYGTVGDHELHMLVR
jgi:hypothetical protein